MREGRSRDETSIMKGEIGRLMNGSGKERQRRSRRRRKKKEGLT